MENELERLKRELERTRYDLIGMAPDAYDALLHAYGYPMETTNDLRRWEYKTAEKIADSVEFVAPESGYYENQPRAACPLCNMRGTNWATGGDGWTHGGLINHLTQHDRDRGPRPCPVMRAAYKMLRADNEQKFQAASHREWEESTRKRKEAEQEIERRRTVEQLILVTPDRKPEFFAGVFKAPSPEDLARAEAKLREAGFSIEHTDNVVAYRMERGDWMILADPSADIRLEVRAFKPAGVTRKRWKQIGTFTLRGKKDWPARIEAELQAIGVPPPEPKPAPPPVVASPPSAPKQAKPPKRPVPPRIGMWDALEKQGG